MLTKDELDYLAQIPASKKVSIKPFDPNSKKTGQSLVFKIKFDGKSFPKYQRAKYEFYNRILGTNLIKQGYNKIAKKYYLTRDRFKNIKYLKRLNSLLKPSSAILDLGCGSGKPVDKFFADHGHKRLLGLISLRYKLNLQRKTFMVENLKLRISPN